MNKELTPLEAFQLFCKELKIENSEFAKTIGAALKRQDSIEITAIDIEQDNQALCKENKKLKRVLEIIREKKVNIGYLLLCDDYEDYLDDFNDRQGEGNLPSFELLTKEEYDLLKKVLYNETLAL